MYNVFELRRYLLHPGQRDTLIELFDRELVETQEVEGMWVVGQFRDLDQPDYFVWVRGFADMVVRKHALSAFYTGPAWKANSAAANATMIDVANVLLLRPAWPESGFPVGQRTGMPAGSLVGATIFYDAEDLGRHFAKRVELMLIDCGARPLACLETEPAENTFPSLPVREEDNVLVWFASFDDLAHHSRYTQLVDTIDLPRSPEHLRLAPTVRSMLR